MIIISGAKFNCVSDSYKRGIKKQKSTTLYNHFLSFFGDVIILLPSLYWFPPLTKLKGMAEIAFLLKETKRYCSVLILPLKKFMGIVSLWSHKKPHLINSELNQKHFLKEHWRKLTLISKPRNQVLLVLFSSILVLEIYIDFHILQLCSGFVVSFRSIMFDVDQARL